MTATASETSLARAHVLPWLNARYFPNGIDLGAGGDPIVPRAIAMDLANPYADTCNERGESRPAQLTGDARDLRWFRDGTLDFVYSSHLLEDFPNTRVVVAEWLRVLRTGGRLVLVLPDESAYQEWCRANGRGLNEHHQQPLMSLAFMRVVMHDCGARVVHADSIPPYSFVVVAEKQ